MTNNKKTENVVGQMFSTSRGAQQWDEMYGGEADTFEKHIFRERLDKAVQCVVESCKPEDLILDMGCGAGPLVTELIRRQYNVIATDFSMDILRNARARLMENNFASAPILRSDCQFTPFRDESFDAVICLGVISYVPDRQRAVAQMHRILKDNGLLIVTIRNYFNPVLSDPVNLAKHVLGLRNREIHYEHDDEFVPGAFLRASRVGKMLTAQGFIIDREVGIGIGPFRVKHRKLFGEATSIGLDTRLRRGINRIAPSASVLASDVVMFVCRKCVAN